MKKLLIGLLVLGTFSSFASDCSLFIAEEETIIGCQNCGDSFYRRQANIGTKLLSKKGFEVVDEESAARYTATIKKKCMNAQFECEFTALSDYYDSYYDKIQTNVRIIDNQTGEEIYHKSGRGNFTASLAGEVNSTRRALRKLNKCK